MANNVIGLDCDNNELEEFMVVRTPFYSDIDFEKEPVEEDPRQYCVLHGVDGNWYLMSIRDWWHKEAINKFERRDLKADPPIIIKPISEAVNYEIAIDCMDDVDTYNEIVRDDRLAKKFIKAIREGRREINS